MKTNARNVWYVKVVSWKNNDTDYPEDSGKRASGVMDLVHSDVCGPMPVNSFCDSRNFVTFIDDYSRYNHFYFIEGNDEALEQCKEFVNRISNLAVKSIKVLLTNKPSTKKFMRGRDVSLLEKQFFFKSKKDHSTQSISFYLSEEENLTDKVQKQRDGEADRTHKEIDVDENIAPGQPAVGVTFEKVF